MVKAETACNLGISHDSWIFGQKNKFKHNSTKLILGCFERNASNWVRLDTFLLDSIS